MNNDEIVGSQREGLYRDRRRRTYACSVSSTVPPFNHTGKCSWNPASDNPKLNGFTHLASPSGIGLCQVILPSHRTVYPQGMAVHQARGDMGADAWYAHHH